MFKILNLKLKRLCFRLGLGWPIRRRSSKAKVVIKRFGKSNSRSQREIPKDSAAANNGYSHGSAAAIHPSGGGGEFNSNSSSVKSIIRVATFNAALFSMAPAVPNNTQKSGSFDFDNEDFEIETSKPVAGQEFRAKSMNDRLPKSILKQSPLHSSSSMRLPEGLSKQEKFARSKLRVSINLPDNEISLRRRTGDTSGSGSSSSSSSINKILKGKAPLSLRSTLLNTPPSSSAGTGAGTRTILEVLRELNADILALQHVKAEEEKEMKPLSDLATALGMNYVFAESWAPEYGNAILSKWPIKTWKIQKIFDDSDFRNVLKATVDVPGIGEFNFFCTHLDHLDESWRMKQINAIIQSTDEPHILAGGLNSLDETDYSSERWTDIVKYYEEIGKPTPKVEVMKYLKSKQYIDAKDFAGQFESVVMIAKGQSVQGTCKYGTRVDYILTSPESPYKFVPGSYSVFSSKGTSDHHIVKADLIKVDSNAHSQYHHHLHKKERQKQQQQQQQQKKTKQRVVKITHSSTTKGLWKTTDTLL